MLNDFLIWLADEPTNIQWMMVLLLWMSAMSLGGGLALLADHLDCRLPSFKVRRMRR